MNLKCQVIVFFIFCVKFYLVFWNFQKKKKKKKQHKGFGGYSFPYLFSERKHFFWLSEWVETFLSSCLEYLTNKTRSWPNSWKSSMLKAYMLKAYSCSSLQAPSRGTGNNVVNERLQGGTPRQCARAGHWPPAAQSCSPMVSTAIHSASVWSSVAQG